MSYTKVEWQVLVPGDGMLWEDHRFPDKETAEVFAKERVPPDCSFEARKIVTHLAHTPFPWTL